MMPDFLRLVTRAPEGVKRVKLKAKCLCTKMNDILFYSYVEFTALKGKHCINNTFLCRHIESFMEALLMNWLVLGWLVSAASHIFIEEVADAGEVHEVA